MRLLLLAIAVACACGTSKPASKQTTSAPLPAPKTMGDKLVALLPHGAQIVVELDLARLRANPVIGETFAKATAGPIASPGSAGARSDANASRRSIALPADVPRPPLATADVVVLAAYGVGTSNAATISVIASSQDVPDATRILDGIYALGPAEWIRQLEARAAIDVPVTAERELLLLRERSMPAKAPGASLRVTARLSFDARVALARQSGLESAPARLSIWADVVDDFVIVIDADAADPGEKITKQARARLERLIRGALRSLANEPALRALGLSSSISRAQLRAGGSWIRTIIAVGPAHLKRVVERANTLLAGGSP